MYQELSNEFLKTISISKLPLTALLAPFAIDAPVNRLELIYNHVNISVINQFSPFLTFAIVPAFAGANPIVTGFQTMPRIFFFYKARHPPTGGQTRVGKIYKCG